MGIGRLLLRIVIGGIFVAHGMQKLTGAFGGAGLAGTEKMMAAQRMYPTRRNALAVAVGETAGGAAIVLGAGMPIATFAAVATMATAVKKVHLKNGPWNVDGGYEFNLALGTAATALTIDGPGPLSLDALIGKSKWGPFWGLLAAGAGVVAASLAIEMGEKAAPADAGGSDADVAPEEAATGAAPSA